MPPRIVPTMIVSSANSSTRERPVAWHRQTRKGTLEAAVSNVAQRAATVSLIATVVVVALKLVAAWLSGSVSVLAEGLQSTVDILMSALAVAAVGYAARPPDREHPYGHGKAEVLAGALQMLVIMATGTWILFEAYRRLKSPEPIRWDIGAGAMAYALFSNSVVAGHLRKVAKQTGSASLDSEALHLRGDSLMSAGVLVGMLLVGLTGWLPLDPICAALTALAGIGMAIRQLGRLVHPLMDGALPEDQLGKLQTVLDLHPEVRGYHNLRTRLVGSQRFIDLHVMLDDNLSFVTAHDIAEHIEQEIRDALDGAVVSIHYEPYEAEKAHRQAAHAHERATP